MSASGYNTTGTDIGPYDVHSDCETEFEIAAQPEDTTRSDLRQSNIDNEQALSHSQSDNQGTENVQYILHNQDDGQWWRAKMVVLVAVIIVAWGLLSLPIIFYWIPVDNYASSCSCSNAYGLDGQSKRCDREALENRSSEPITYNGDICVAELKSAKTCLQNSTGDTDSLLVARDSSLCISTINNSVALSSSCKQEALPFLCLHFFGLWNEDANAFHIPSLCQCKNVQEVCSEELNNASNSGAADLIPLLCGGKRLSCNRQCNKYNNCINETQCHQGFQCIAGTGECRPLCSSWKQYPDSISDILVLMAACIGIISGISVMILAVRGWKKLLVFPTSFAVYQTITLIVIALFVVVNFMDVRTLYCSSDDLIQSVTEPTAFCIIAGTIFYYCILQLGVFWLCHVLAIFWKLYFPFQSRAFTMAHRIKYVHITCVIISILFPIMPVVATMVQFSHGKSTDNAIKGGLGFRVSRHPPILCIGQDKYTTFYSLLVPLIGILQTGIAFLVLVFWIIHRQQGLFRTRRSRNPLITSTAERKVLIMFVYYVILSAVALLAFSLRIRHAEMFAEEILCYFECERDPANFNDCPRNYTDFQDAEISSLSYILFGLFPLVNLIFMINHEELKQKLLTKFHSCWK